MPAGSDVEALNCGGGWKRDWRQIGSGAMTGFVAADQLNLHKATGPKYPILCVIPGGSRSTRAPVSSAGRGRRAM
ncbi:MAG: hypothetical protein N2444_01285 [Methylocystis sp.]|nr:hypothetical protein [Methylocystis sp.]